jgi:hypothetical protein
MGCNKCKKKNKEQTQKAGVDFEEIGTENLHNVGESAKSFGQGFGKQSIMIKIITFLLLLVGFPLIYVVVLIMLFTQFFMPKRLPSNPLQTIINWFIMGYAKYRARKELRRREKEFSKNRTYSGDSELADIEVFQTEDDNIKDDEE